MSKPVKKSIRISYLTVELRSPVIRLPIHWLNFKNYYTTNGRYPSNINWQEPLLDVEGMSFDDIVNYYDKQDSEIYLFSSYVWSHMAIMAIAKEIKARNPKRIIVIGGPHLGITHNKLDWFFSHKFVDAICEPTSYGEWFIEDMLNQYVEGDIDWKQVSFSIFRTGRGPTPSKITFEFPQALIPGNEDIVYKCKDLAMEANVPLVLPMELSRGCPYACVFCEWGGGIGGKVIRKPLDMIKQDLDYIPQFGIENVQIVDANYGIFKEDVDVSNYIEQSKNLYGLPRIVELFGITKSKQEARWAVIEPLARCGAVDRYKISLQSISQEVLRNIKRTDIPREQDFQFARYLENTYGVRSDIEFILGLPGYTKDDFYDEIDLQYEHGYQLERYIWLLLPDSPAFDPEYKKQHGIKTAKVCVGKSRLNSYEFNDIGEFSKYHISDDPVYISDVEFVTKANGYTEEEYTEFFFVNYWIVYNRPLFDFTKIVIDANIASGKISRPSILFRHLYEKVMSSTDNKYLLAMRNLSDQMQELVSGNRKEIVDFREYNLPHTNVSANLSYIFESCAVVFEKDYLKFLVEMTEQLNLDVPDSIYDQWAERVTSLKFSTAPKYDKFYQIRTFYETFINEKYSTAS